MQNKSASMMLFVAVLLLIGVGGCSAISKLAKGTASALPCDKPLPLYSLLKEVNPTFAIRGGVKL